MGILQQIFGRGPARDETPAPRPQEMVLQPGEPLAGHYVVRKLLGRGGMGEVYLSEDMATGEVRAAKVMRASAQASVGDLLAFRREAMAMLDLGSHPFVVRLHELHERGRDTVLILQYVAPENGCTSLEDYIRRTNDYTDNILGMWAVQFCVGMEHALSHGIHAHRDIKPSNLLVGASPFLKISDFGLVLAAAGHVSSSGRPSADVLKLQELHSADGRATCGTPGYIAPELATGEKAGPKSDMFSFGVTLWQLAARSLELPFEVKFSGNVQAYQEQAWREAFARRIRRIDSPYFDIICRCLAADPARRYPNFSALREDLKAVAKHQGFRAMDFIVAPGFRGTVEDHVSRARAFAALGRRGRALKILNKAVEFQADSAAALIARGDTHLEMSDTVRGLRDFQAAHELDPTADAPAIGMAKAMLHMERVEAAEKLLYDVLGRHPRNTEARIQLASALSRSGRHDEALSMLDAVLKEVPDHAGAHEFRARTLWSTKDTTAALEALKSAIALDPMRVSAGLMFASLAHELGDSAAECSAYARLLHLYRGEVEILNEVAIYISEHGPAHKALGIFDTAAEREPSAEGKAVALVNKGNALLNLKDLEGSRLHFEKAVSLDPRSALAHRRLGDWHNEFGDPQRACGLYAQACKLDPDDAFSHRCAGTAYLRSGDFARAQEHLSRSLELIPSQPHIRYNLAAAFVQQGMGEEAVAELARAVAHDPEYARAWYLKAQIEHRMQRTSDAKLSVQHALRHPSALSADELDGARQLAGQLL
ncbi:tetratricopeptide repeat protein [Caenimonas sedimenti]|uniref:Tetratricopeptide repeat protein n=1 Tax=Caenimonas sedimenti TaxID=2596921 RepID=A0A562ZT44_9BURK|nr:serine/threonine-protein kinase [Caenimonas sedimenti]TWO71455.1 tetratricopeptide repeat protein [Caenimonas sedimenti]